MSSDRNSSGFTLLEILVALMILGLAAAALLPAMASSLKLTARAAGEREAILFAESKLAELGAGRIEPGTRSGTEEGGLTWYAEINREVASPALARFSLALTVQPRSGPPVRLATTLLGPPQ